MSFSITELTEMFEEAISLTDAEDIRELYANKLDNKGLGGLIRAGK